MKALYTGTLFAGLVDCYVLEDGRRVVSQRGIVRAITAKNLDGSDGPKAGRDRGDLGQYMARLPANYREKTTATEIEFSRPGGGTAIGREGSVLVDLCDAYVAAGLDGELHPKQMPLARNANRLKTAWAKVGIDALIDEATGYQRVRADNELQGRLSAYLRDEKDGWRILWGARARDAISKLYGWKVVRNAWPPQSSGLMDWIYKMALPPEVRAEMKRRIPEPRHKNNQHQLTTDPVREMLVDDVRAIATIADQCGTTEEFRKRVRYHFRKAPLQLGFGGGIQ